MESMFYDMRHYLPAYKHTCMHLNGSRNSHLHKMIAALQASIKILPRRSNHEQHFHSCMHPPDFQSFKSRWKLFAHFLKALIDVLWKFNYYWLLFCLADLGRFLPPVTIHKLIIDTYIPTLPNE